MNCIDCPSPVSPQSRTGRCKLCALRVMNADPVARANRAAGIRLRYTDPVYRARKAREIHERHMLARADPEKAERISRNIWIARARLTDPDVRARFLATRPEAGRKRSATVMAWCPPERIEEYRRLTRSKRMKAAEARQFILADVAKNKSEMTPFERAMERVRNGAGIITVPRMPRPEPMFTLGGVTAL